MVRCLFFLSPVIHAPTGNYSGLGVYLKFIFSVVEVKSALEAGKSIVPFLLEPYILGGGFGDFGLDDSLCVILCYRRVLKRADVPVIHVIICADYSASVGGYFIAVIAVIGVKFYVIYGYAVVSVPLCFIAVNIVFRYSGVRKGYGKSLIRVYLTGLRRLRCVPRFRRFADFQDILSPERVRFPLQPDGRSLPSIPKEP